MKKVLLAFSLLLLTSANVCDRYKIFVESAYDGDTITADIYVGFNLMLDDERIRLYGIDAPEVRGIERPKGLVARDALRNLIVGETLEMDYHGRGKYGRMIGDLFLDTINISNWMVSNNYAEFKQY